MPEFVTCPVCGCKVQMPESMFGKRVRCFGCDQRFVADPAVTQAAPPVGRQPSALPRPSAPDESSQPPAPYGVLPPDPREDPEDGAAGGPFCPGCGRRVAWHLRFCPHCGEEYEEERDTPYGSRVRRRIRRDAVPHRGHMLSTLGNVALGAGALSLCLFGIGAVVAIPLGIAVWVMAQSDLRQMRAGVMDAQGRHMTETARASALTGLVLSLFFAAGYAAMFLMTL